MTGRPAPLRLRLRVVSDPTPVGEEPVFEIDHEVLAPLHMELVELNEDRTRLTLDRLAPGRRITIELSGRQHRELHRLPVFTLIGRRFAAAAGDHWTARLRLFNYIRPLPAGRYRLVLAYQYGDSPDECVAAGAVEFEMLASDAQAGSARWFATARRRGEWGRLWSTEDGTRWHFQVSAPHDPGVLRASVALGLTLPRGARPLLAHLDAMSGERFERQMVWADGARLCWFAFSAQGPIGDAHSLETGLPAHAIHPVEPPLQRRDGALRAAFVARSAAAGGLTALVLDVSADGRAGLHRLPLSGDAADLAVVAWASGEASGGLLVYGARGGTVLQATDLTSARTIALSPSPAPLAALLVDPWQDEDRVHSVAMTGASVLVVGWDASDAGAPGTIEEHYTLEAPPGSTPTLIDAVLQEGGEVALAVHLGETLWLLQRSTRQALRLSLERASSLRLISTVSGMFLEAHDASSGFIARPFGDRVPPPGI